MRGTVRAGGAVLWRPRPGGGVEVCVVHRPRHADWSLPKGKVDAGESELEAALREVAEETGQRATAGEALGTVHYRVGEGIDKTVAYWAMRAQGGDFLPSAEVDEVRWLAPEEAAELLTYPRDREVLGRFLARR